MKNNPQPPPNAPDLPLPENVADSLLMAGTVLGRLQHVSVSAETGVPVAVVPEGYELRTLPLDELEAFVGKPNRKTGDFPFADTDSFVRYIKEHRTPDTRVFATIKDTSALFRAVLNFHGTQPSFNDHCAFFELRSTGDWKNWIGYAGQAMTQGKFAQFLEDNAGWFVSPNGADLLELISNLEGKSHVDINQAIKLQNGAIKLNYSETVELRGASAEQPGELVIPKEFIVAIRIFEGTATRTMHARLRYRIENRKISFFYEPIKREEHVREICDQVVDEIETETGIQPFRV